MLVIFTRVPFFFDQIGWLKELGITETIVPLPPGLSGKQAWIDRQHWVAEEIMPAI